MATKTLWTLRVRLGTEKDAPIVEEQTGIVGLVAAERLQKAIVAETLADGYLYYKGGIIRSVYLPFPYTYDRPPVVIEVRCES